MLKFLLILKPNHEQLIRKYLPKVEASTSSTLLLFLRNNVSDKNKKLLSAIQISKENSNLISHFKTSNECSNLNESFSESLSISSVNAVEPQSVNVNHLTSARQSTSVNASRMNVTLASKINSNSNQNHSSPSNSNSFVNHNQHDTKRITVKSSNEMSQQVMSAPRSLDTSNKTEIQTTVKKTVEKPL